MVCSIAGKISREALHKRFTLSSVKFMKRIARAVFKSKFNTSKLEIEIFKSFSSVLILDSSWWQLPKSLAKLFPGFGGVSSKASVRLQLAIDYLRGTLKFFDITEGTKNDSNYAKTIISKIRKNTLVLADLGYYSAEFFQMLTKKSAYFVSKLQTNSGVYHPQTGKKIDLEKLLKKAKKDRLSFDVTVGRLRSVREVYRLVAIKVPKSVSEQRRRFKRARARCNKSQVKKSTLLWCDWTLLITNTKEEILPAEKIHDVYRLRWQIELVFKQFKSVLAIDNVNTARKERLLCELYGKLILAFLVTQVYNYENSKQWGKYQRELSFDKFCKRIQERLFQFANMLANFGLSKALKFLIAEIKALVPHCLKLKQNSRTTSREDLLMPLQNNFTFLDQEYTMALS